MKMGGNKKSKRREKDAREKPEGEKVHGEPEGDERRWMKIAVMFEMEMEVIQR